MVLKQVARLVFLIFVAFVILMIMQKYDLVDFNSVFDAFIHGTRWVLAVVLSQIALSYVLLVRYFYLLKLQGVSFPFKQVASANFVSNGIGQWAPGALAVMEVLRVSLMLGAHRGLKLDVEQAASKIAAASIFDRFVGFASMLFLGGVCSAWVFFRGLGSGENSALAANFGQALHRADGGFAGYWAVLREFAYTHGTMFALGALCVFSLGASLLIFALPLIAKQPIWAKILARFGKLSKLIALLERIAEGASLYPKLLLPFLLSCLCVLLSCVGLYWSSFATGVADLAAPVPFLAIMATFSITAISTLLPLGFGGLGGYQLVAVAVFQIFDVKASIISSASVLQNALLLIVNSALFLLNAHHSGKHIMGVLKAMRAPQN